ncbi:MAG TPA: thioredoxin domain-containing protein [Patescibacteria group bacterium]|nr:thioredoxin domain-containing protein [Patescibacteria group bacterium]
MLIAMLFGIALFVRQIFIYYQAIRSGKTTPFLEQRIQSSFSKLVANANVSDADLARLASTTGNPSLGHKGAPLTIVEFIDFGCPFSQLSAMPMRQIMQKFSKQVYFVVRDFPLDDLHPNATNLALAARCAGAQGKFWSYHDLLFAHQDKQTDADLENFATQTGLDLAAFRSCYQSRTYERQVQQDLADGLQVGVQGTPTFFFNGVRVQGGLDFEMLQFLVNHFLSLNPSKL